MAATLTTRVELLDVSVFADSRVQVRLIPGAIREAVRCALSGLWTARPETAAVGMNADGIASFMKGYWVHTPKFGTTDHSQRWRFKT
ncbi:MAG: hypothetical protein AAF962_16245 [Actinomycetota bacterium]